MQENEPIILVVDDTEDNLDLLEFALKRKPVRMIRASSGQECLVLAEEKRPDIILLDIQMPEMDGFETIKRLRANPGTAKIPVIFLTAQRKDADSIATDFHGFGIRIEDDILVTETSCEVMTKDVPKEIEEIETLMQKR